MLLNQVLCTFDCFEMQYHWRILRPGAGADAWLGKMVTRWWKRDKLSFQRFHHVWVCVGGLSSSVILIIVHGNSYLWYQNLELKNYRHVLEQNTRAPTEMWSAMKIFKTTTYGFFGFFLSCLVLFFFYMLCIFSTMCRCPEALMNQRNNINGVAAKGQHRTNANESINQ